MLINIVVSDRLQEVYEEWLCISYRSIVGRATSCHGRTVAMNFQELFLILPLSVTTGRTSTRLLKNLSIFINCSCK